MFINIQLFYKSNGLYEHKYYFSNNFKPAISEYRGVLPCEGYDYEEFSDGMMEAPLSELFFTKIMKMLTRHNGLLSYGRLRDDFFSISDLLNPEMKIRLRLIRVRPSSTRLATTPTLVLEFLIAHSILVVLLSKMINTKNEWTCLHMLTWSSYFGDSSKDFDHCR